MSRCRVKTFDPVASLNGLIDEFERGHGHHSSTEPSYDTKHLTDRIDAAAADFRHGVLKLHGAEGNSAAVEELLEYLERVARRAVRLGDEFGASTATKYEGKPIA